MPLSATELAHIEPIMDGLRAALGDDDYSTAWCNGRSLSQDEAVDEALTLLVETAERTTPNVKPGATAHDARDLLVSHNRSH